jgi:hypothetical protein
MKPKEYIKKYNLDNSKVFNQNEFIFDITNDFISNIEYLQSVNQLSYDRYKTCIKEIKQKFDGICNKSIVDQIIWDKQWKYFFATVIAPMRENLFKDYLDKQKAAYEERKKRRDQWNNYDTYGSFGGFNGFANFFYNILSRMATTQVPEKEFTILDLPIDSTEDEVKKRYWKLALNNHPDKGGSKERFNEITTAKNKCLAYISKK